MKRFILSVAMGVALSSAAGLASAQEGADAAQLEQGKTLFTTDAVPACAICHTMKDAGATGAIGPDLDQLKPSADQVVKAMQTGLGAMPSFSNTLDEQQMQAVAAYIVHVTGGDK